MEFPSPPKKKNKQLFRLTPITIMLASSVFMLIYSLLAMMDINAIMLKTVNEQEHTTKVHSSIYAGLTNRSNALFMLIKMASSRGEVKRYLIEIDKEKELLLKNQSICIHNKDLPIDNLFIEQAKMLKVYATIEKEIIDLVIFEERESAFSLYSTRLITHKEATLRQIIKGNTLIRATSAKKIKDIGKKIFLGIALYGFLNIVFIGLSLFFSIRLFQKYNSKNKALIDSTKLDLLTNLSNRLHLIEEIDEEIAEHPDSFLAVAFIDIDYFKSINDMYGHTLADNLLIDFGKKLTSQLDNEDHCLSRFGGDEFVLLIRNTNERAIDTLMSKVSKAINTNYHPQENIEILLTSSIGVSLYPKDATSTEMLLHNSDLAMYQAKKDGRACYRLFSNKLTSDLKLEHEISQRLQTALSNKENIFLLYQPLLNTQLGTVTECEALLRWNDSKLGRVSPDLFIAIAEKTNLIKAVNFYVIDEACKQQQQWVQKGNSKMRININLSGNQEIFTSALKRLKVNIHQLGLSPSLFGIEITERSLFEINPETVKQLQQINEMGIKISVDDFGTGYSSLLYLAKLPLTTLKIDKEFISNICNQEKDNAIVLSIIRLGQSLNLEIVAEGVETHKQSEYLKAHSCNIIQGYYFSKPILADEIEALDIPASDNDGDNKITALIA